MIIFIGLENKLFFKSFNTLIKMKLRMPRNTLHLVLSLKQDKYYKYIILLKFKT